MERARLRSGPAQAALDPESPLVSRESSCESAFITSVLGVGVPPGYHRSQVYPEPSAGQIRLGGQHDVCRARESQAQGV